MFAACKIHQEQGVRGESETVAYLLQEHAAAYERQVLCGHPAQIYIYQVRYRDGGHHIPYAFPESEPGERDASQYSAQQQSYHSERTLGETDLAGGQSQSSCIYGVDQEQRGYLAELGFGETEQQYEQERRYDIFLVMDEYDYRCKNNKKVKSDRPVLFDISMKTDIFAVRYDIRI